MEKLNALSEIVTNQNAPVGIIVQNFFVVFIESCIPLHKYGLDFFKKAPKMSTPGPLKAIYIVLKTGRPKPNQIKPNFFLFSNLF